MSDGLPLTVRHQLLSRPRFEILPTESIGDTVRAVLPTSVTVTVTASPVKGLDATLELATALARDGYDVVPHLAARMITGRAELEDIVARLKESGVRTVFVPAGDATEPAGDFAGSLDLLHVLTDLGDPFEQVGITGYPESHPSIDDDVVIQSMWDKRQHATHIVSNMTFDAEHVARWAERLRRRGITLPLYVGVPGPVERTKLLGMATKIGVGQSIRFLAKQRKVLFRIAAPGFSTDRFVDRISALSAYPALGIERLHVYTFNQVEVCEQWRQQALAQTEP
ncbi:MAG: methylenetetrahydrofolate reductase [Micrococcales bacterium]|nr:methylenetetrahydrofolate reductase [Micrococcales bacterium]